MNQRPLKNIILRWLFRSCFLLGSCISSLLQLIFYSTNVQESQKQKRKKKRVQRAFVEFYGEVMSYTEFCKTLLEIPATKLEYFQFRFGISALVLTGD